MTIPVDPDLLSEIANGLTQRVGFRFSATQYTVLWNALQRRAQRLRLPHPTAYHLRLRQDADEWSRLAEEITVHETSFFRHAGQFRVLSEFILPELIHERAAESQLRLWSAACATGEEPYSLSIAVQQFDLPRPWQVEILATDLSRRALDLAEKAVFNRWRLRSLPEALVARYFEPLRDGFRVLPEIRSRVTFEQFNLTQVEPLPEQWRGMDIIFCENVLIYFSPEALRRVVRHLREALREGGYLFLGYAETLYGMSEGFLPISFGDAYVYRRQTTSNSFRLSIAPLAQTKSVVQPVLSRTKPKPPPPSTETVASGGPMPNQAAIEALIDSGNLVGATQLAERWLSLEPDSGPARFILSRLYAAQDQDARAADLLRQLLAGDALHAPSYVLLGILCYRQGELEEARAQFQHALYLEPQTPLAYFFLGNIHQQGRQPRAAIHAYENAIQTAERFAPAWDSSFTPQLLIRVCERNIARLEKAAGR